MAPPIGIGRRLANEIGLTTLSKSSRDVHLLLLTRCIRMIAYGSSTIVFSLFFSKLDFSNSQIGLFMSLTLLGDVLISLVLTLVADALGRRRILIIGSLLMTFSGIVFSLAENYWLLLFAAVVGVISPSGNEIGPFRAIEESTIAQLTEAKTRSDVFAWYVVFGTFGVAGGSLAVGWTTDALQAGGWTELASFRFVFVAYAVIGLVKAAISLRLSPACESQRPTSQENTYEMIPPQVSDEQQPMLGEDPQDNYPRSEHQPEPERKKNTVSTLSAKTRRILLKLCALFSVDSLASGMAAYTLIFLFMYQKFDLHPSKLGQIYFATSIVSSFGNIAASSVAKRIGLVKTMVFTHLPSAIFLASFPMPSTLRWSVALLVARASLASMDQAPRSAFLSAVVLPEERTAVMGIVNTVKTLSQSAGPLLTGGLAEGNYAENHFWMAFVVAGALKATYDIGMLSMFVGVKLEGEKRSEAPREGEAESEQESDAQRTGS